MGNATWVEAPQGVREMSGNFLVPGTWSPCIHGLYHML